MSHVTESADDRLDDSSFRHTHHRLAAGPRTHGDSIFVTCKLKAGFSYAWYDGLLHKCAGSGEAAFSTRAVRVSRSLAVMMRGGSITSVSFVDDPRVLACSLCTAEAALHSSMSQCRSRLPSAGWTPHAASNPCPNGAHVALYCAILYRFVHCCLRNAGLMNRL